MNARNGLLIGLLVTVVAGFGFYTLALKPKRAEATKLETQIAEQQQALDAALLLLASNEKARRNYRGAYAAVVRLGKAVPADDDVRSLVVQLEAAAKKAGVEFSSINVNAGAAAAPGAAGAATQLPPGASVGAAGFPVMQFSFEFSGQFFDLGDFFRRLHGFVRASNERLRVTGRLLTLDSLKLEPDATGFPKIVATVGATSYLVSPLEGSTAGATPAGPAAAAGAAATTTPSTAPGTTPAAPAAPGGTSAPAPATATSTGGIR